MQACAASSPTPTHLTLKGSQGQSSLSATLMLPLTQSVSKVCCKAGNCLMTDKIATKLYSFVAILSIYGIDQCCLWHISVIKEPATVPDVRSAYSLPLIHVLFMITNMLETDVKHVTTITALIGSAPALFSDPQPGKPGYGPRDGSHTCLSSHRLPHLRPALRGQVLRHTGLSTYNNSSNNNK